MDKLLGRKLFVGLMAIAIAVGALALPPGANAEIINGWVFTAEDENGDPLTDGKIYVYEQHYWNVQYVGDNGQEYDVHKVYEQSIEAGEFFVPNAFLLTGKQYQIVIMSEAADGTPIIYQSDFVPGSGQVLEFTSESLVQRTFTTTHVPDYAELSVDFEYLENYVTWPILLPVVDGEASLYISASADIVVTSGLHENETNTGYILQQTVSPSDPVSTNLDTDLVEVTPPSGFEEAGILLSSLYGIVGGDFYSDKYFVSRDMDIIASMRISDEEYVYETFNPHSIRITSDTELQIDSNFQGVAYAQGWLESAEFNELLTTYTDKYGNRLERISQDSTYSLRDFSSHEGFYAAGEDGKLRAISGKLQNGVMLYEEGEEWSPSRAAPVTSSDSDHLLAYNWVSESGDTADSLLFSNDIRYVKVAAPMLGDYRLTLSRQNFPTSSFTLSLDDTVTIAESEWEQEATYVDIEIPDGYEVVRLASASLFMIGSESATSSYQYDYNGTSNRLRLQYTIDPSESRTYELHVAMVLVDDNDEQTIYYASETYSEEQMQDQVILPVPDDLIEAQASVPAPLGGGAHELIDFEIKAYSDYMPMSFRFNLPGSFYGNTSWSMLLSPQQLQVTFEGIDDDRNGYHVHKTVDISPESTLIRFEDEFAQAVSLQFVNEGEPVAFHEFSYRTGQDYITRNEFYSGIDSLYVTPGSFEEVRIGVEPAFANEHTWMHYWGIQQLDIVSDTEVAFTGQVESATFEQLYATDTGQNMVVIAKPKITSGDLQLYGVDVHRDLNQFYGVTAAYQDSREYESSFYMIYNVPATISMTDSAGQQLLTRETLFDFNNLSFTANYEPETYTVAFSLPLGPNEELKFSQSLYLGAISITSPVSNTITNQADITVNGKFAPNQSITVTARMSGDTTIAASQQTVTNSEGLFATQLHLGQDGNYVIRVYNPDDETVQSTVTLVTLDTLPPAKPNVTVSDLGLIEWEKDDDVDSYILYAGLKGEILDPVATVVSEDDYQLEGLEAGRTYDVKLIARDAAGNQASTDLTFTVPEYAAVGLEVDSETSEAGLFMIGRSLQLSLQGSYAENEPYQAEAVVHYIDDEGNQQQTVMLAYDKQTGAYLGSFDIEEGMRKLVKVEAQITKGEDEKSNVLEHVLDQQVGATLSGTVTRNGEAVTDAKVYVNSSKNHQLMAETDEFGAFQIRGAHGSQSADDLARLTIVSDQHTYSQIVRDIELSYGTITELSEPIQLPTLKQIAIEFVESGSANAVTSKLQVKLYGTDEANKNVFRSGYIDVDGRLTSWSGDKQFERIPTGNYLMNITGKGSYASSEQPFTLHANADYIEQPLQVEVSKRVQETTDVTLNIQVPDESITRIDYYGLSSQKVIEAFGYDAGTHYQYGQVITVTEAVYEGEDAPTVTGSVYGGFITIPNVVLSDDYHLDVQVDGYRTIVPSYPIVISETDAAVDIMLDPGMTVKGTLVNEDGQAVHNASVSASSRSSYAYETIGFDSNFALQALAAGEALTVTIEAPGYASKRVTIPEYATDSQLVYELGEIQLEAESYIHGVVLDANGEAVKGASVHARGEGMNAYGYTRTDRNGYFKLRDLVQGSFTLDIYKYGMPTVTYQGIETSADEQSFVLAETSAGSFAGEGNQFTADTSVVVPGKSIKYRLDYTNNGSNAEEQVELAIELPASLSVDEATIRLNGMSTATTVSGQTLRVEVLTVEAGESGTLTFEGTVAPDAEAPISVIASIDEHKMAATTQVLFVTVQAPTYTADQTIQVYGKAKPGTVVKLYSGNVQLTEVQSEGRWWYATVRLPVADAAAPSVYPLVAKVYDGTEVYVSEPVMVNYSPDIPSIEDVNVTAGWNGDVTLNPYAGVATFAITEYTPLDTKIVFDQEVDSATLTFLGESYPLDKGNDGVTFTGGVPGTWSSYGEQLLTITFTQGDKVVTLPLMEIIVLIDPSGYVFEGSMDNRLEGVTAIVQEFNEDSSTWHDWNTDFYGQVNPQLTDQEGRYGWDVIDGKWRVQFAKEGYEGYISRVMEVPPAETQLNVPLVRTTTPEIISVSPQDGANQTAVNTSILIEFDRPMKEALMDEGIQLIQQHTGELVAGEFVLQGWNGIKEDTSEGGGSLADGNGQTGWFVADPDLKLSKQIVFEPNEALAYDTVYTIHIDGMLEDYAGNSLLNDTTYNFTTASLPAVEDVGGPAFGGGFFIPTESVAEADVTIQKGDLSKLLQDGEVMISLTRNQESLAFSREAWKEIAEGGYAVQVQAAGGSLYIPGKAIQLNSGEQLLVQLTETVVSLPDNYSKAGTVLTMGLYAVHNDEQRLVGTNDYVTLTLTGNTNNPTLVGSYKMNNVKPEYLGRDTAIQTKQSGTYALLIYEQKFADVADNHWAKGSIDFLVAHHIVSGMEEGRFAPSQSITRAQAAKMIADMLQLNTTISSTDFRDVKDGAWYTGYIVAVERAGIFQGSVDLFRPNDTITREELAVAVAKVLDVQDAAELTFADASSIAGWAEDAVAAAVQAGIIAGNQDNLFEPQNQATRAEAASMLQRLIQVLDQ